MLGGEFFFDGGDGGELLQAVGEALLPAGVGFDEAGAVGGTIFAHAELAPAADVVDGLKDGGRQIGAAPVADAADFFDDDAPCFEGGGLVGGLEDDLDDGGADLGHGGEPFAGGDVLEDGGLQQFRVDFGEGHLVDAHGLGTKCLARVGGF